LKDFDLSPFDSSRKSGKRGSLRYLPLQTSHAI
jgi:hypothetical protein